MECLMVLVNTFGVMGVHMWDNLEMASSMGKENGRDQSIALVPAISMKGNIS
jgi:hypothetical protein